MFKVITIIVLAISCLTSTLLAQSNFLERNNSAFSVFGGVGSSGEDHGYKTIVIGISRAKGFDLNIARIYQTNPQANNFSANFSFYFIRNKKSNQPISLSVIAGSYNLNASRWNYIYRERYTIVTNYAGVSSPYSMDLTGNIAATPSITFAYLVRGNNLQSLSIDLNLPICFYSKSKFKFLLEPFASKIFSDHYTRMRASGGLIARFMFGGK